MLEERSDANTKIKRQTAMSSRFMSVRWKGQRDTEGLAKRLSILTNTYHWMFIVVVKIQNPSVVYVMALY